ncbi:MAG: DegV family protein [Oscillospiraceae bacterium]|nr:DegV family protein [Oscillospiraceae bacterium]
MSFTILTDTSANLPKAYLRRHGIRTIPYTFMIDGHELGEDFSFEGGRFYGDMRRGKIVTTSQIPPQRYMDFFRSELVLGHDVLFVSMSSGISGSYNSACIAAEELRAEFPGRKLRLVDALGASLGEGLLVVWAVRDRKAGLSVDEAADRLLERRYGICQVFTVDDLRYLKRGGRLSNLAAAVGTVLQIKPLLKGDNEGKIVCFDKLRGRRRAIEAMAEKFNACALPQGGQTIGIAHADCEEDMNYLISLLRRFREGLDIMTVCYEPVTGSHVGPGTLALFFEGSKAFR